MFRPQAQAETHSTAQGPLHASRTTHAETHSRPGEALRGSRPPCAETHSKRPGPPLASASGTYFFLFLNRLQAQAHRDPGSSPRASRKDLFFLFINRLQAQAHRDPVGSPRASRTISKNFFYFLFLDYKHKRAPWHSSSGPGWPRAFLLTAWKM